MKVRLALALVFAASVGLAAAQPARAKERARATLVTRLPLTAPAGTRIDVRWRLFTIGEGGRQRPFDAGGIFVRLRSAAGAAATEAFASGGSHPSGIYRATVTVPDGGIGGVQIGLMGWTSGPKGEHRSDLLFPITNAPRVDLRASAASVSHRDSKTWPFVVGASAATLGLALLLLAGRRRLSQARSLTKRRPVSSKPTRS